MIEKLSKRIFLLIIVSLSVVIIGIIALFAFLNYDNTINATTGMFDRFIEGKPKRNSEAKEEEYRLKPEFNIEGLYNILVENGNIVQNSDNQSDRTINEYALKIAKRNREKGIIGKYVYKARRMGENKVSIILIENENAISHIRTMLLFSAIMLIISFVVIYIIAKRLSKTIVKPVEDTFEKQKQFISDASHELKTPLAVIEANIDVLENEIGTNKWIGYIQNEANSMDKLVNELLLLTKVENIDNSKEYENFNLSEEVEIILSMFESIAFEKQIEIINSINKDIIINGSKGDIEHIVSILIDNAIKHTEKQIIVELKKEKNEIVLEVKNMGEPIPEEEKDKIFERFYRIDKSRNRKEKRYGLGLAIAKSIVEKYKGKIEVSYKDNFTIFKVVIPD